ncbi:MAG: HD domain-containing protein [Chloroflexi bacterium]|nr:HD domain-containing protein [Chloroflexota bacterium]
MPNSKFITLNDLQRDAEIAAYLRAANAQMKAIGFTEHGERHAALVAQIARNILAFLNRSEREAELAALAGYLHDAGNLIHREFHQLTGALLARDVLARMEMPFDELTLVMGAIGNHEESDGNPVSAIAAAVIIADKADVHASRVQNEDKLTYDIHDRVNLAARRSFVRVDAAQKSIALELEIDPTISSMADYFEIFTSRMLMCRRAAQFLGCQFSLIINGQRVL